MFMPGASHSVTPKSSISPPTMSPASSIRAGSQVWASMVAMEWLCSTGNDPLHRPGAAAGRCPAVRPDCRRRNPPAGMMLPWLSATKLRERRRPAGPSASTRFCTPRLSSRWKSFRPAAPGAGGRGHPNDRGGSKTAPCGAHHQPGQFRRRQLGDQILQRGLTGHHVLQGDGLLFFGVQQRRFLAVDGGFAGDGGGGHCQAGGSGFLPGFLRVGAEAGRVCAQRLQGAVRLQPVLQPGGNPPSRPVPGRRQCGCCGNLYLHGHNKCLFPADKRPVPHRRRPGYAAGR